MKTSFFKIGALFLMCFFLAGCQKEPDSGFINIEKPVIAELPLIYQGCNLKVGNTIVIHKQTTLDSVFSTDLISQIPALKNIDFTIYDVLAGADTYTRGIFKIEHHLIQSAHSIYSYKLYVNFDLTLQAGIFFYGVIIDKLPSGAHVIFDVEKLE